MERAAVVIIVFVLAGARAAAAHPLDVGYLNIDSVNRSVTVRLDLEVTVAAGAIRVAADALDSAAVRARASELADATYRASRIATDAGACSWTTAGSELRGRNVALTGGAECPAGATTLRWELPFLANLPSTFELLINAHGFAGDRVAIANKATPWIELSSATPELGVGEFVWSGVEHIGAAPREWRDDDGWKLPDGIDHILFLLALMLGGGTLLRLVGIASGFTLGHSITLALAALDVARPPSSLIEPLIALTIAAAALEAFTGRFANQRWKIATAFGLIHGFGFANALTELHLSTAGMAKALFGYNLGVELGQVAIVLLVAPAIMLLYRKPALAKFVVQWLSAAIFLAGAYWLFERAFA